MSMVRTGTSFITAVNAGINSPSYPACPVPSPATGTPLVHSRELFYVGREDWKSQGEKLYDRKKVHPVRRKAYRFMCGNCARKLGVQALGSMPWPPLTGR